MATSYLVGYGSRYPQRVHHRGPSMESYRNSKGFRGCIQGCNSWCGRQESNPNVLLGALAGVPDNRDQFRDGRENYKQTEACTYNTAPLDITALTQAQLQMKLLFIKRSESQSVPWEISDNNCARYLQNRDHNLQMRASVSE
nr:endoglucanase 7-like [Coffea arabica]XP_027062870.1 endoglucanase 7-like [Coffea arabica]